MKGSEFAATFGPRGWPAWEVAAVDLARKGGMVDWGWAEVTVKKGDHVGVLRVQKDVFAIGERGDALRLPLCPERAQDIANENGWLLETPLITYMTWRAADIKLNPEPMVPNKGANMAQYVAHNQAIEAQLAGREGLVAGHKKSVVVGNLYKPGKVLIFGWYKPSPDVFDDGTNMADPAKYANRQPRQPYSNVHGSFYLDYSHGIRFVHGVMKVDGQDMSLAEVMHHPQLSALVSHEGPVRTPRYPASVKPQAPTVPVGPVPAMPPKLVYYTPYVPTTPSLADLGLSRMMAGARKA